MVVHFRWSEYFPTRAALVLVETGDFMLTSLHLIPHRGYIVLNLLWFEMFASQHVPVCKLIIYALRCKSLMRLHYQVAYGWIICRRVFPSTLWREKSEDCRNVHTLYIPSCSNKRTMPCGRTMRTSFLNTFSDSSRSLLLIYAYDWATMSEVQSLHWSTYIPTYIHTYRSLKNQPPR